jgi:hypothetical protein
LFSCWEHSEIKNSFMSLREIASFHQDNGITASAADTASFKSI